MKTVCCFIRWYVYPLLFILLFLLTADPLRAGQYQEDVSNADYSYVKGLIRSISLEHKAMTIKPRDGHSITVIIDPKTEFEGFFKLDELRIRQSVKVWYRPGKDRNIALKILKPVELGC